MRRTRILLADLPQLLREIVVDAMRQDDLEVVGSVAGFEPLSQTIEQTQAEVIVIGHDDPDEIVGLLGRRPPLAVIAVRREAREARYYELRPHGLDLGEISPSVLIETIRRAAASWERDGGPDPTVDVSLQEGFPCQ